MNTFLNEKLVSSMSEQHYCHPLGRVGYRAVHHIINNDPPDQFKVPPALIVNMGRSKGYQKSDCCSNPLLFDLQRMKPVVYVALLTLAATYRGGRACDCPDANPAMEMAVPRSLSAMITLW